MNCPYCGSKDLTYLGIDDGAGDYGESLEDLYRCLECGEYCNLLRDDLETLERVETETEEENLSFASWFYRLIFGSLE